MKNRGKFNWYKVIAESIALSLNCTAKSFLFGEFHVASAKLQLSIWTADKIHQIWLNGKKKCWKSIHWVEGSSGEIQPCQEDFWHIFCCIPPTAERCHKPHNVLTAAEHVMIVIKEIKIFKESHKTQIYSITLIQDNKC